MFLSSLRRLREEPTTCLLEPEQPEHELGELGDLLGMEQLAKVTPQNLMRLAGGIDSCSQEMLNMRLSSSPE